MQKYHRAARASHHISVYYTVQIARVLMPLVNQVVWSQNSSLETVLHYLPGSRSVIDIQWLDSESVEFSSDSTPAYKLCCRTAGALNWRTECAESASNLSAGIQSALSHYFVIVFHCNEMTKLV